jgi:two-component system, cell cycle sensor histidine kinase and response regulator CckA
MMACVLLVEDERIVAEETAHVLRAAGHSVVGIAASGEQALELADRMRPDLALVDIGIQGPMDGIALAHELSGTFGIAVIYLTGHAEPELLSRATMSMPYGYMLKPFDERTLQASVDIALSRHRLDQTLREHGAWLSTLLRSIGVAVLATDEAGRVRFANPLASELAELDARVTPHFRDCLLLVDDYRSQNINPVGRALETKAPVEFPPNAVLVQKSGHKVPVEGSAAPLRDPDGQTRGVVVAFRDVRERAHAEREQQRVQRLEALGTLAAGIAHDFNNMLTVIVNSAFLARDRSKGDPRLAGLLTDIETSGERASALTAQLTAFAKGGTRSPRALDIRPLVNDTVTLALRGSGTRAEIQLPEDLPFVLADANQIGQVFTNLALNARDAMSSEGVLEVGGGTTVVGAGEDPVLEPGHYVEIWLKDSGVGIAEENLERVFEPYFTTKETGSGLGLASSHGIVHRHGGTLRVDSAPGRGSTFTVLLPATDPEPQLPPTDPTLERNHAGRVLVMDDEADLRRLLGMCLEELGYDVELAPHGERALAAYEAALTAGRKFDLVILDLTVRGGMGGIQTLARLKAIDPTVRAIATTGYSESDVLASFALQGFVGALPKPYRFGTLALVLREALGAEPGNLS